MDRRHVLERAGGRSPLPGGAGWRGAHRLRRAGGRTPRRCLGAEHRGTPRPPAARGGPGVAGGPARRGRPPWRAADPARGRGGQRPRAEAVRGLRVRPGRRAAWVLPTQQHRRAGDDAGGAGVTQPLVLGIETSCDETGIGVVRGHTLLADAVASSVDAHARFGGVAPEVASRAHLEAMVPTMQRALDSAGVTLGDLDAIAVTAGPGLAGALLVGVAAAKAYALLVSGGHSNLLRVEDLAGKLTSLGSTIDDAAGEAFDKVARLLGLPFPGGPPIDKAAREGSVEIAFPRGLTAPKDLATHRFDFSFSGLKTAVARWVEARERAGVPVPVADVAASFQEAVCDVLTAKAVDACRDAGIDTLVIGGGVAANSRLRALAEERCAKHGISLRVPRPKLCTDNGAMVAALGSHLVAAGVSASRLDLPADSAMPVTAVTA